MYMCMNAYTIVYEVSRYSVYKLCTSEGDTNDAKHQSMPVCNEVTDVIVIVLLTILCLIADCCSGKYSCHNYCQNIYILIFVGKCIFLIY